MDSDLTARTAPTKSAPAGTWLRRDDRNSLLLCAAVALAFLAGINFILKEPAPARDRTTLAKRATDDLTTGSIVFVPTHGERCRNSLIDNATWRIRDNGVVDCRAALSQNAHIGRLRWSTARVDVIRHGFTKR
jgi:hypothetical protein